MNVSAETVKNQALALSRAERLRLVVNLLQSIEERPSVGSNNEAAWLSEANRRYLAYQSGQESATPAEEVFEELRKDDL